MAQQQGSRISIKANISLLLIFPSSMVLVCGIQLCSLARSRIKLLQVDGYKNGEKPAAAIMTGSYPTVQTSFKLRTTNPSSSSQECSGSLAVCFDPWFGTTTRSQPRSHPPALSFPCIQCAQLVPGVRFRFTPCLIFHFRLQTHREKTCLQ